MIPLKAPTLIREIRVVLSAGHADDLAPLIVGDRRTFIPLVIGRPRGVDVFEAGVVARKGLPFDQVPIGLWRISIRVFFPWLRAVLVPEATGPPDWRRHIAGSRVVRFTTRVVPIDVVAIEMQGMLGVAFAMDELSLHLATASLGQRLRSRLDARRVTLGNTCHGELRNEFPFGVDDIAGGFQRNLVARDKVRIDVGAGSGSCRGMSPRRVRHNSPGGPRARVRIGDHHGLTLGFNGTRICAHVVVDRHPNGVVASEAGLLGGSALSVLDGCLSGCAVTGGERP